MANANISSEIRVSLELTEEEARVVHAALFGVNWDNKYGKLAQGVASAIEGAYVTYGLDIEPLNRKFSDYEESVEIVLFSDEDSE